ncbi:P22 phage major capsid protein family protein [Bacillus atrophaeus]|uniref:phage major capsid protein n=1 Tax=Bacillus subtilis group TaxID=653685 RepID=UPI002282EA02|nr:MULTISPECIES: phage capsid protein [Bacillus subtilis group]MCY7919551.1 P22 coat protein - protein 5 domain protein [Bacillus vallismortis]MCY8813670.1 P22 coat protein - protein 5 domain protein [Bacillus atrophaeus]MCY8820257.1 P22 coat protein - protein 5 domain protein [Bacillus atrophaeus]MCY8828619.1 P22 coat protein - protein 5 domain protein [Bacillus atrophaeus]MCY8832706.1 P22 coat protein - protein 5 domain protein [Bacillus atrophaeus]
MALDNFIPSLWSARLLYNLQRTLVYGQLGVINRDYEGEILSAGDSVTINNIGRVSVGDYTKNKDMKSPETLDSNSRKLLIDQMKYFNFQIDDVDKIQQNPKLMDAAMQEAAYALKNTADSFIASHYVEAANTIGDDAKVVSPTKNDAYEYLVDLSVKLDESDVTEQGRWVVLPPWYEGLLLKDDRFVKAGNMSSEERLLNGVVGQAAGFTVLKSNNTPVSTPEGGTENHKIIAGHSSAWSYADQATQVEAYRPEKRFADAVKGLHLYGAKVTRPEALAVLSAARPK